MFDETELMKFVGGPIDGEFKSVRKCANDYTHVPAQQVPIEYAPDLMPVEFESFVYHRLAVTDNDLTYMFFALAGLTPEEAWRLYVCG